MVAVLFARSNSVYRQLGADVWDVKRDARKYCGAGPVVAHPPCRAWGRLRGMAKPREDERDLALFAVGKVRQLGGVLEHPAHSTLWDAAGLPVPGVVDGFGGFTVPVFQGHAGHRAPKATFIYVVGCRPSDLPAPPFGLGLPGGRVEQMGRAERERTPEPFARWLMAIAEKCRHEV